MYGIETTSEVLCVVVLSGDWNCFRYSRLSFVELTI